LHEKLFLQESIFSQEKASPCRTSSVCKEKYFLAGEYSFSSHNQVCSTHRSNAGADTILQTYYCTAKPTP
jgi:hypothetical protein